MADIGIKEQIRREQSTQDLSAGALDFTTNIDRDFELSWVALHFSAALSGQTFTISVIPVGGSETVWVRRPTRGRQDFMIYPDASESIFKEGDEIRVQCTNSGTPAITANVTLWGLER